MVKTYGTRASRLQRGGRLLICPKCTAPLAYGGCIVCQPWRPQLAAPIIVLRLGPRRAKASAAA